MTEHSKEQTVSSAEDVHNRNSRTGIPAEERTTMYIPDRLTDPADRTRWIAYITEARNMPVPGADSHQDGPQDRPAHDREGRHV